MRFGKVKVSCEWRVASGELRVAIWEMGKVISDLEFWISDSRIDIRMLNALLVSSVWHCGDSLESTRLESNGALFLLVREVFDG